MNLHGTRPLQLRNKRGPRRSQDCLSTKPHPLRATARQCNDLEILFDFMTTRFGIPPILARLCRCLLMSQMTECLQR